MDVEEIQPGENFAKTIEQVLAHCSTALVVIGPLWREQLDLRAAHNEQDYVVHEIAAALSTKKTVVPVLVGGTPVSCLDTLPAALADLSFHQAVELHDSVPCRELSGASLLPVSGKASDCCSWFFCRLSSLSRTAYSSLSLSSSRRTVWAFHRRSRLGLSVAPPFGFGVPQ
jgi:hypothetical protein